MGRAHLIENDDGSRTRVPDDHMPENPKAAKRGLHKKGTLILKKSMMDVQNSGLQTRKATNVLWAAAAQCPLYQKMKTQKRDPDTGALIAWPRSKTLPAKDLCKRSNRALGNHAIKTIASGAAAAVGADLARQAKTLRCSIKTEYAKYPMLPGISPGAAIQYEAAIVAYAQELFGTAQAMRDVMRPKHTTVRSKCAQAACDVVNAKLNAATGFMPRRVIATASTIKKKVPKIPKAKASA